MKRRHGLFCLLLAGMLLMFSVPSVALEGTHDVAAAAACVHDWDYAYTFTDYTDVSATVCLKETSKYYVCSKCGYIKVETTYANVSHVSSMTEATCSGTVHTYYYSCRNCGRFIKTTTQPCPNPGNCPGLPV